MEDFFATVVALAIWGLILTLFSEFLENKKNRDNRAKDELPSETRITIEKRKNLTKQPVKRIKTTRNKQKPVYTKWRQFTFSGNTSETKLFNALDSMPKKYDAIKCERNRSVLTLALDQGRLRFQLWKCKSQTSHQILWSSPMKKYDTIFKVFSSFARGKHIESMLKWREDSGRIFFD